MDSKHQFEKELKKSGLTYVIHRPSGFFYDIAKVFRPMIEKGEVSLLKTKKEPVCNAVDTADFAEFIVRTMTEDNKLYNIGGKETYTYREIAEMFFKAYGRPVNIKYTPAFMMDVLAMLPKIKKAGKSSVLLFSKFNLTHDCVGDTEIGGKSFREYIETKAFLE